MASEATCTNFISILTNSQKGFNLKCLTAIPVNGELTAVALVRLFHFLSSLLKYMNTPLLITETVADVLDRCKECKCSFFSFSKV